MLSKLLNRTARRSARAVLLTVVALVVTAAFGAANSNASFTAPYTVKCTGSSITGRGATFQAAAETALINWWRTSSTSGQTGGCGPSATQTITYQALGTGAGRSAFGAGVADRDPDVRYIALDEAPTPTQRTEMEAAQGTTGLGKLAIAPIATGATTLIVNFPKFCELPSTSADVSPYARFKVSNARLEAAWVGDADHDEWGELLPDIQAQLNNPGDKTDEDCKTQAIKRVVRFDSSGTTFSFKQYLDGINPATGWQALANTAWPNSGGGNVVNGGANGAGVLAQKVKATAGSIGYADLATARANDFSKAPDETPSPVDPAAYTYSDTNAVAGYPTSHYSYSFDKTRFWLPLEEATAGAGVTGSGIYVEPTSNQAAIRNLKKGANCVGVVYNGVPHKLDTTIDQYGDWSNVNGTLTNDHYALCTITYAGFWDDYSDVYGTSATEQAKARTVKDFLTTSFYSGQNELNKNDYTRLPDDLKIGSQQAIINSFWLKP